MIRIEKDGTFDRAAVEVEIARLRYLIADLEKMLRDGPPTADDLAGAPILEEWDYALRPVLCMDGTVSGHPDIRDGRLAKTSEILVMDHARTVIRTISRWYRLGRENLEYDLAGRSIQ